MSLSFDSGAISDLVRDELLQVIDNELRSAKDLANLCYSNSGQTEHLLVAQQLRLMALSGQIREVRVGPIYKYSRFDTSS